MSWTRLGAGTYNVAYQNAEGTLVFKVQKDRDDETDLPERSVRLWNEINQGLPLAYPHKDSVLGKGWVCPFVTGEQSTDEEMAQAVVNIFNRTGRIITDAVAQKNFLTTPNGTVVCVDIGMALNVEKAEHEFFTKEMNKKRRKSIVSLKAWANVQALNTPFFEGHRGRSPKTIGIIESLLFIKTSRPDIHDASFLINNPLTVTALSDAYKNRSFSSAANIKEDVLDKVSPYNFDVIKESCFLELNRYIRSRGSVVNDTFRPSLVTHIFRNTNEVTYKASLALTTMGQIQNAGSLEELKQVIINAQYDPMVEKSKSDITTYLGHCAVIIETAQKNAPENVAIQEEGRQLR